MKKSTLYTTIVFAALLTGFMIYLMLTNSAGGVLEVPAWIKTLFFIGVGIWVGIKLWKKFLPGKKISLKGIKLGWLKKVFGGREAGTWVLAVALILFCLFFIRHLPNLSKSLGLWWILPILLIATFILLKVKVKVSAPAILLLLASLSFLYLGFWALSSKDIDPARKIEYERIYEVIIGAGETAEIKGYTPERDDLVWLGGIDEEGWELIIANKNNPSGKPYQLKGTKRDADPGKDLYWNYRYMRDVIGNPMFIKNPTGETRTVYFILKEPVPNPQIVS